VITAAQWKDALGLHLVSVFKGAEYYSPGNEGMCRWNVNEKKNCRSVVRMRNSQQQKPQLQRLPFQPCVHAVYVCALPPADSDTADLGKHHPTLEPAASSSVDFRHSTALGPGSKNRLGVQFHSQAREGSKLEHQHLVLDDEGYEGATSSMLKIYAL